MTSSAVGPAIPPRSRGRRQRSASTRDSITEAMLELLTVRRLEEVTVQEIVDRAQVSRQTFYAHFETKYSVVADLVDDMGQTIYEHWRAFLEADGTIEETELHSLGLVTLGTWREQATLFSATIEGWHNDVEIHDVWNGVLERFAGALAARVGRVRAPQADDDLIFPALISLFERTVYLAVSAPEGPFGKSDDEVARVLARMWLRTLELS
ncbi:MAG: TetR/AcrR family transcriptional regulator [Sporichthyaceae bacterium]